MKTEAEKYLTKEYGSNHISEVMDLHDTESMYGLMQEYANKHLTALTKQHEAEMIAFACEFAEWTQNNAHNKDEAYEMGIVLKNGEWIYAGDENTYTTPELLAQFMERDKTQLIVITRQVGNHKSEYLTGQFNPTVEITTDQELAKEYESWELAEKELHELQLRKNGFVVVKLIREETKGKEGEDKIKNELGDELCKYCPLEKKKVYGVDGGYKAGCEGSKCSEAYDIYLTKPKEEKNEPSRNIT